MANVFDRLPPQAERENIDPQRASEIINEIDNARIRNRDNPIDSTQDPRRPDWQSYYNSLWRIRCTDADSDPAVAESRRITERHEREQAALVERAQAALDLKARHGAEYRPAPPDTMPHEAECLSIEAAAMAGQWSEAEERLKTLMIQYPLCPAAVKESLAEFNRLPPTRPDTKLEALQAVLKYAHSWGRLRRGLRPRGEQ